MRRLLPIIVITSASVASIPASAYTFLSGNLPATLTVSASPYIALSVLSLTDATCSVEAGVTVYFNDDTGIEVRGTGQFVASGTAEQPISLLGYQGASWRGLRGFSIYASTPVTLRLDYCVVRNASQALRCEGYLFDVVARNCEIDATGQINGIQVRDTIVGQNSSIVCEDVSVIGPAGTGIELGGDSQDALSISRCEVREGPGTGFALYGAVDATDVVAEQNNVGIYATLAATVTNSTVSGNFYGIQTEGSPTSSMPVFQSCTIQSNQRGVYASSAARFTACNIYDNLEYDVYCIAPILQFTTIDMQGCYWGPATTQEMQVEGPFSDISTIFDWWDDHAHTLVDYQGFLVPVAVAESASQTWGKMKAAFR